MAEYHLIPGPQTLHGAFSPDRAPILRIQPGDTVVASTLDSGWGLEAPFLDGTPRKRHPMPDVPEQRGHALIGPLWIEGAQPGATLAIHVEEVIPGAYGYTYAGGFPHRVHEKLGLVEQAEALLLWTLDPVTMIGTNQFGHRIRLRPFLGVMGMPPPEPGFHPTPPPRKWGGNIDCKDLVAGTTLFLPIPVPGGLFSFGDGHAAQGQGEVSVLAVECPIARVRLRFDLIEGDPLEMPRAWTPAGWLTFGFHENLEQAALIALEGMVDLIQKRFNLPLRKQALALATAIVDLHVTQIANPAMGVHAVLAHDALSGSTDKG